jgi:nucleotide-binding universal stress UspA family protein
VKHLSRVLAAVDFSSPARSAFEYALALAKRHSAELVVIQAVPREEAFNQAGRERGALKSTLRQKAAESQVDFKYRVQQGDPAEIILLHARSVRPDVIVLGSHQRRGLDRWRAGSVSERVIAKARVPVFVVPARLRPDASGAFRHVAVAVDLRPSSDAAVERALEVASDTAVRVTLLHAVRGFASGVPPSLYRYGTAEYERQLVRDARHALQLAVPAERRAPAAVHTRVVRGDAATELPGVLETIGADLLVVGVPRRGMVANALFGSTAVRLLKGIDVPLLAIPDVEGRQARGKTDVLRRAA